MRITYLFVILYALFFLTSCKEKTEIINGSISLKVDGQMYTNVSMLGDNVLPFYGDFVASDYLIMREGIAKDFALKEMKKSRQTDNTTYELTGVYQNDGIRIEKIMNIIAPDSFPGMLLFNIKYVNKGEKEPIVTAWVNHDLYMDPEEDSLPVWSLQCSSTSSRGDWVLPVTPGFYKKNYMGMNNSDYGGGIPVCDLWRKDGGFAVGVTDDVLRLVSFPVSRQKYEGKANTKVLYEYTSPLDFKRNDTISTYNTFVSVHTGDFYNSLRQFSRYMQSKGMKFAAPEEDAFEAVWCAWGYERNFTMEEIKATLPKVKELGFKWVDVDDGFQVAIGDWDMNKRFPGGDKDMKSLVDLIHQQGLKAKLWWAPLAADPNSQLLKESSSMKLLTKERLPCMITWWNCFYLSPVNPYTEKYTNDLVEKFIGDWGFDGLKLDGQHLNCCPPDYNRQSGLDYPEQAIELLPAFYKGIFETARKINPNAVIQNCPCGTAMNFFNMPYMNQAVSSDPLSSWQIRLKGKVYRAIFDQIAYYADHVELSDNGNDFPTQIGIGAVVGSKFTYPKDNPDVKISYLLTPEKEVWFKKWVGIYNDKMLSKGEYLNLYDLAYDKPETHAISKDGKMYYAFYADEWDGNIVLKGLENKKYTVCEYTADPLKTYQIDGADPVINVTFKGNYLIEVY